MLIRKATVNELSFVAEMTEQLFADEPSDVVLSNVQFQERLLTYVNTGCECYLLIEDTTPIGYALVNLKRDPYYLIDFFICRQWRRRGNGTTAFNLLIKELNTKSIDLDVFCWNVRGRKFWEGLGFTERAIIMRKQFESE